MSFYIIKKGSNNFWHTFSNNAKTVNISDFEAVLDSVAQTFNIQAKNGANVPQSVVSILDIIVIDETDASLEETFTDVEVLRARLVVLGYTPYLGAGNADSITGLIEEGTNVTITGTGTLADPYVINSTGGGGSQNIQQVLDIAPRTFAKTEGDYAYTFYIFDSGVFSAIAIDTVTGETYSFSFSPTAYGFLASDGSDFSVSDTANITTSVRELAVQTSFGSNKFLVKGKTAGSGDTLIELPNNLTAGTYILSLITQAITNGDLTHSPSGDAVFDALALKQATLVSGTNIKTINGATILGSGDISTTQTTITGNAGTATALQTPRTINGTSFDGTANITVTAAAGTLTGSTLNSGVTASSLTSLGTLTALAVTGTASSGVSIVETVIGGTGSANGGIKIGSFTTDVGGIWSNAVTPSTSNFMIVGGPSNTDVSAPTTLRLDVSGNIIASLISTGMTMNTAKTFTFAAGTTTVVPFKMVSGTNLTTPQNGGFEYNGTNLFFTRAGAVREGVITQSAVTTEVVVSDTTITVNIGGTTYKLLAKS